ncbi:uncharacterized protein LOC134708008 [Mytilus trossulus]|uniref:uncharacterized protein LOC134708008 n=1 Tax=Mytilus trossulus TaxID=6551 RepID=UPI0030056F4C
MRFLITVVGLLASIILVTNAAMTTKHPHVHHSVTGLSFFYDMNSNNMVMKKDGYCYFVVLTPDQESSVKTQDGLRSIEASMLTLHTTAAHLGMTGADHAHLSHYIYNHFCKNEPLIKLVE